MEDGERRRMAAMMLNGAGSSSSARYTAPQPSPGDGKRASERHRSTRRRRCCPSLADQLVPVLLEAPGKVPFRTAFCAALTAWGAALVLALGCFDISLW